MASSFEIGRILDGNREELERRRARHEALPVDQDWSGQAPDPPLARAKTIARPAEASALGTFSKKETRTLRLEPTESPGWWFDRADLPESLPIKVCARNVWTTGEVVSNIVLRSGAAGNYMRLVEHIVALKRGLDVDGLLIRCESGDPPLFERGSLELVQALDAAGRRELDRPARYVTVREPATIATPQGGFVAVAPAAPGERALRIDCSRDFPNAIGQQRIRFVLNDASFRYGATARTNATARQKLFIQTAGKLFADVRNLGYNSKNVLVAGKRRYLNEPGHVHQGKSLEAAWHRAALDLLAALALIEEGRFVGDIVDCRGGHFGDVELVKLLYANDLLAEAA